jgi:multiple sugar transport system substrate-binding protein
VEGHWIAIDWGTQLGRKESEMKCVRSIWVIGVLVVLALSLGLGIQDASAQAKLTMTIRGIFTPVSDQLLKQQVQAWATAKGASVEIEFVSLDNLGAKASSAAETGVGPDIIYFPIFGPSLYADKLVDMDDLANELGSKLGGWVEVGKTTSMVGGKWKAIPHYISAQALIYRRDVLQEILGEKVPDTWEDLLRVGKKLRPINHYAGFAMGHATGDANNFIYSLLWSYGMKEVEKDGKTIALNSPETRKGLEFLARLYKEAMPPAVVGWDDSSNNRMWLAGILAITGGSGSIYWQTQKDAPALRPNTRHALWPRGPATRAAYAEMWFLGVFKYSKNQELAKDLIRYLLQPEQYSKWLESGDGNMTPLLNYYNTLPMWKDPNLTPFIEHPKYARAIGWPGPVTRAASEVNAKFILVDMAAKVAQGMPAQKAIDEAVAEMKKIYAAYK